MQKGWVYRTKAGPRNIYQTDGRGVELGYAEASGRLKV